MKRPLTILIINDVVGADTALEPRLQSLIGKKFEIKVIYSNSKSLFSDIAKNKEKIHVFYMSAFVYYDKFSFEEVKRLHKIVEEKFPSSYFILTSSDNIFRRTKKTITRYTDIISLTGIRFFVNKNDYSLILKVFSEIAREIEEGGFLKVGFGPFKIRKRGWQSLVQPKDFNLLMYKILMMAFLGIVGTFLVWLFANLA